MSILAKSPDLTKIIKKAVERIGEDHAKSRDHKEDYHGITLKNEDLVIEKALKEASDEMAEKMVLENTIDGMIKDTLSEKEDSKTIVENTDKKTEKPKLDESTTKTIKKLVSKKLKEAKRLKSPATIPGKDAYEKSIKKSKSETDTYLKDTKKKFEDYANFDDNTKPEFPTHADSEKNADGQYQYYRNDDEQEEFIDVNRGMGLQDADGIENLAKISDYLEGSSETGNAQTDKDGKALGNVVPSDLGKKMQKTMKLKKEKNLDDLNTMSNDRRFSPNIQKVKTVKEDVAKDMDEMKKLWSYNKKTQ